jgi:hypothetical protein
MTTLLTATRGPVLNAFLGANLTPLGWSWPLRISLKVKVFVPRGLEYYPWLQGDQIGRIFTQWAIVYFGQWFENYRSSPNFLATFSRSTSYVLIFAKNDGAIFLATFSQTHLVTVPDFLNGFIRGLRRGRRLPDRGEPLRLDRLDCARPGIPGHSIALIQS